MRWKLKAAVQSALSVIPGGERVNYLLQRHITRSLPLGDSEFLEQAGYARAHIERLRPHLGVPLASAHFYEFGAGYELVGPLTFRALGVHRQTVVDIRPLLRADLVAHTIDQLRRVGHDIPGARLPPSPLDTSRAIGDVLLADFGIRYLAPVNAASVPLDSGSVDCVTSTSTLEHIPARDLPNVLAECGRVVRSGGLLSCIINYQDHYAYADPTISRYNFLRYSSRHWMRYNSPLHYQNRLRHTEYVRLLNDAGFDILDPGVVGPDDADLRVLRDLRVAPEFRAFSVADLGIRWAHILARKRAS